jgi:hypothetical protein
VPDSMAVCNPAYCHSDFGEEFAVVFQLSLNVWYDKLTDFVFVFSRRWTDRDSRLLHHNRFRLWKTSLRHGNGAEGIAPERFAWLSRNHDHAFISQLCVWLMLSSGSFKLIQFFRRYRSIHWWFFGYRRWLTYVPFNLLCWSVVLFQDVKCDDRHPLKGWIGFCCDKSV